MSSEVRTDKLVNHLIYILLAGFELLCSIYVWSVQNGGTPVDCYKPDPGVNALCWAGGLYVYNCSVPAFGSGYPGIGSRGTDCSKRYLVQHYYLPLVLFCFGWLSYIPRKYWTTSEKNVVAYLLEKLKGKLTEKEFNEQMNLLAKEVVGNTRENNTLASKNLFSQFLYCISLAVQYYSLTVLYCFGDYMHPFKAILHHSVPYKDLPVQLLLEFPRVAHCEITTVGHSGSSQRFDDLCFINANVQAHVILTSLMILIAFCFCLQFFFGFLFEFLNRFSQSFRIFLLQRQINTCANSDTIRTCGLLDHGTVLIVRLILMNVHAKTTREIVANIATEYRINRMQVAKYIAGEL